MVSLLLFKIMHSFTKSQQVYLTDGEKRVQVFSPVRQRQESLQCCSGGCAIVAAAAKRLKPAVAGLADHCTDLSSYQENPSSVTPKSIRKPFLQVLVVLSCCSSLREVTVLASVTITLSFAQCQFTEFKKSKCTSIHSSKIPPIRHINAGCSEVSICCRLYLTQAAMG